MIARRVFVGAFLALVAFAPARAAVVIHEYALRGTLAPTHGGPSLIAIGGNITALGYVFAGNPLILSTTFLSPANSSLEFSFTFRVQSGDLDPALVSAALVAPGVFAIENALVPRPVPAGSALDAPHDVHLHFVLTRNAASNTITGFINGQTQFVITETVNSTPTLLATGFTFSLHDGSAAELAALGGRLDFLRVYSGVLTGAEVGNLFAAASPLVIPEPSTYALLGAGLLAFFINRRYRNRAR